jgi:hypothetical protein
MVEGIDVAAAVPFKTRKIKHAKAKNCNLFFLFSIVIISGLPAYELHQYCTGYNFIPYEISTKFLYIVKY